MKLKFEVWHSLGANVYFEPMRVLKTAFNNPAGKKTSHLTKAKRTDRAIVVKLLSVLDGEKFVRLPELPRASIHRTPRPLGSLSNPSILATLNHPFLCRPEQRYDHTGHMRDTKMKCGSSLPAIYGPSVCVKRLAEPTELIRMSLNSKSCNLLTQRQYSTNNNGNVMDTAE